MPDKNFVYTKKDYVLISLLLIVYSIIALYNLGTLKAPETYWQNTNSGETFTADLGEIKNLGRVYYYGGLGEGKYRLDFSRDAATWKTGPTIQKKNIFVWDYIKVDTPARYIKFTAESQGAALNELGFFTSQGTKPLVVKSIIPGKVSPLTKGRPENLFDEQDTIPSRPSFYNGMFFDEIYHARTAYEYLHLIVPYETSHPPLGKLFITLGISLFGMNPFGWRIVGTLFGTAMIFVMYLFGRRLFQKPEYAFICALLMALDFMHFVQTRIATIEVFAVFFIILMYYFMYKYYVMSLQPAEFKKSLVPLGLSGLTFGLGAACKWSSILAGMGLAVIFLAASVNRYRHEAYANRRKKPGKTKRNRILMMSVSWGIVFFMIVPLFIYCLSYIPLMMIPGEQGFKTILVYQLHMLNYHKNLVATHPFSSTWWEWPIIKKPMWYYSGQDYLPPGRISSIVAMGNPAVWWVGIGAVIASFIISFREKNKKMFVVLVGLASVYLPWVLVSRLAFIYYFFASVPFVILCITFIISRLIERNPRLKPWIYGYLAMAGIMFIMFYPILSGLVVSKTYAATFLRWFQGWYFFS